MPMLTGTSAPKALGSSSSNRWRHALADGDRVYALIRASAVNQDGRTGGISVPNPDAQELMLRDVYRQAGVLPSQVHYIEAHGTGTPVGDPIEVEALGRVFGGFRPADTPCWIGSVKSNIGHLEAASGMAGLIKAALCLNHGEIPANLHFETPNPRIPFASLGLRVPTALEAFPALSDSPRVAGVNSFGFGGTNAHVVLQEPPTSGERQTSERRLAGGWPLVLPISARSPAAVRALAESYLTNVVERNGDPEVSLADVCFTAGRRRSHHNDRLAIVARSKDELAEHLRVFLANETHPCVSSGVKPASRGRKLVFVFTGMGPQWWGMGRQLLEEEPVFRRSVEICDKLFREHSSVSLLAELFADERQSRINETEVAQPAIFALQVGLAAVWEALGVRPDAIVGHSVGEVAAAHVAGALAIEDAVRVIYYRSVLQARTAGQGRMLAIGLPPHEAELMLNGYQGKVSIAAANSPVAVTLSGDPNVLASIDKELASRGVFSRFLRVDVPYHSPAMEPLKLELLDGLSCLRPLCPSIPLFSTVTGQAITGADLDASYWWRNVRSPVLFAAAVAELKARDYELFLELGPHPALAGSISECFVGSEIEPTVFASLRRHEPDQVTMLAAVARLYSVGYPIDWKLLDSGGGGIASATLPLATGAALE